VIDYEGYELGEESSFSDPEEGQYLEGRTEGRNEGGAKDLGRVCPERMNEGASRTRSIAPAIKEGAKRGLSKEKFLKW